jgi:[ribosomal protein S5]-alanine N-acetyltransferase
MKKVEIRYQRVSDAKRFFEILNNPNFIFFSAKPATIEEEKKYLKAGLEKKKKNIDHNFGIIYDGKLVGGCGIMIHQHRKYIAEIGYFLDEPYWGKGIVAKAIKQLENIAFNKLEIHRIEILMNVKNKQSMRIPQKLGYHREGIAKGAFKLNGKYIDNYRYAKIKKK